MESGLSAKESQVILIYERVCSGLSLLGSFFIILTFSFSKGFRKPINRMVFYATFGNLLSSIGTMISRAFVHDPTSEECQLQAFLIQMFMPADAYWTLAMAVNVYLAFYHRYDAKSLRQIEFFYIGLCYGIPFVPALAYLFVHNDRGHLVYGNATLWCWITPEWEVLRITTFYGPVWLVIIIVISIYGRVGWTIQKHYKELFRFRHHLRHYRRRQARAPNEQTIANASPRELDALPNQNARSDSDESLRRTQPSNIPRAYAKCALLFFAAIFITWLPSSSNRVYSLIHNGATSPVLESMSAAVLPLQGFWNAVIYIVTSWNPCQHLFRTLMASLDMKSMVRKISGRQR